MRKICSLILMLFLTACGMGGGDESSKSAGANSLTEVGSNTPTAKVDINIRESPAKSVALAPTATKLRLVITNPNLSTNGTPFKFIVDGDIPAGNTISGLKFPIAKGYTFELITYVNQAVKKENPDPKPDPVGDWVPFVDSDVKVNRILKHAKSSGVTITTTDTGINLDLTPVTATFTLPATAISGTILAPIIPVFQTPTPLQPAWNLFLKTDETKASAALHATSGQSSTHTMVKAPYSLTQTKVFGQGEFYISSAMLDTAGKLTIYDSINTAATIAHTAEKVTDWTFNYPNPEFGDSYQTFYFDLLLQGIEVGINGGS